MADLEHRSDHRGQDSPTHRIDAMGAGIDDVIDLSEDLELVVDPLLEKPVRQLRADLLALRARINRLAQWARRSR